MTLLLYIAKACIVLTLMYTFFSLLMRREALHRLNRVLLLSTIATTWLLPCMPRIDSLAAPLSSKNSVFSTGSVQAADGAHASTNNSPSDKGYFTAGNDSSNDTQTTVTINPPTTVPATAWGSAGSMVVAAWLAGVGLLIIIYVYGIVSLLLLIGRGQRVKIVGVPDSITVIETAEIDAPCSWMNYIIINPNETRDSQQMMLRHEIAHVQMYHSWDLILAELTTRLLWFLPFAWMLRQDLIDVHEFEADEAAMSGSIDIEEYQYLLVRKASSHTKLLPVVNSMGQTGVRRRFEMMYRKSQKTRYWLKAAIISPIVMLAMTACSWLTPQEYPLKGWWHFDWIQNTGEEFRHVIPVEQVHIFNDSTMFDIHYSQRSDHALRFGFQAWDMRWDGKRLKTRDGMDSLSVANGCGQPTAFVLPDADTHLMLWEKRPDQLAIVNGPHITEHWSRCQPDEQLREWLCSAIEEGAEVWYDEYDRTFICSTYDAATGTDSIVSGWIHTYRYLTTNGNRFTLWYRDKPLKAGSLDMGGNGICGELDDDGTVNIGGQNMSLSRDPARPDTLELQFSSDDKPARLHRLDHLPPQFRQMLATMK